jgi:hypothetical protein
MPERYSLADELLRRTEAGVVAWAAQHQQNPGSLGSGRLFGRFDPAVNVSTSITPRPGLALALSLDFNINPGMHGLILQYDPHADMFGFYDEIYGDRMDVRGLMERFKTWLKEHGWIPGARMPWPSIHVHGDATGESQWAGTSESCYDLVRRPLKEWGIPYQIRHHVGNPPLRDSIDATNEAFLDINNKAHVMIHPRCVGLLKDLKSMKADSNGMIDKHELELGHFADCGRYAIHFCRPLHRNLSSASGGRFGTGALSY